MSRYTKQDIFNMVEEEDVEFIRLQFTDMFGTLKNVAITSSQLEKALSNECMFDGSCPARWSTPMRRTCVPCPPCRPKHSKVTAGRTGAQASATNFGSFPPSAA